MIQLGNLSFKNSIRMYLFIICPIKPSRLCSQRRFEIQNYREEIKIIKHPSNQ